MLQIKEHMASKVLVILLTVVLVTPLFVKLNHVFDNHKHEICKTPFTNHFHEYEIDCDFYDFKINIQCSFSIPSIKIPINKEATLLISSQYFFISDYQQLHFSLRGPPLSV